MIQIKKLKRPTKKSGNALSPGNSTKLASYGVFITNIGKNTLYVDRVTPKKKKKKKK